MNSYLYSSCIKIHSKHDFENTIKYDYKKYHIYNNIHDLIKVSSKNKKLYFIDSYRLPIDRKISSFFQNIHKNIPDYNTKSVKDIIKIFNEKYLYTHCIKNLKKNIECQRSL